MNVSSRRTWLALVLTPIILFGATAPVVGYLASTGVASGDLLKAAAPLAPLPVALAMVVVLLMTRTLAARDELRLEDVGWRKPSGEDLAIGVVVGIAVTLGNILSMFPRFEFVAPEFDPTLAVVPLPLAVVAFTIAVFAEDSLYRGYALRQLRRRYNTIAAVGITSAFYALLTPPFHWMVTVWAFGIGVVLCAIRFWRDSLWPVVIAHWIIVLGPRLLAEGG